MRGKKRRVVEVLARDRVNPSEMTGRGYYQATVRLDCGHNVKATAPNRYRKDDAPVIAYCRHPECIMSMGCAR